MALFTKVSHDQIDDFLKDYTLGSLISFEGIVEGVENTNYKILTTDGVYILTIFGKRVSPQDLPFFMNLQKDLIKHGFNCPIPIENKKGSLINNIAEKPAVIISFLNGEKVKNALPVHCKEIGSMIAKFTNITKLSKNKRQNSLNLEGCERIFIKCQKSNDDKFNKFFQILKQEFEFLKKNWPKNLPKAIIHGDLFKENIFFIENKISGVIDFYFACEDFIAYELALAVNDWCFDTKTYFKTENYFSLLEGFNKYSMFNKDEKKHFNILLRGAAVRILVTRLHDTIYNPEDAIVIPKDPLEYLNILKWHQQITNISI